MTVPATVVHCMTVAVMDEVDVVAADHGRMAAVGAVLMVVVGVEALATLETSKTAPEVTLFEITPPRSLLRDHS